MNWIGYALIAALLQSAASIVQKEAIKEQSSLRFAFYLSVLKAVLFLPLLKHVEWSLLRGEVLVTVGVAAVLGSAAFVLTAKCIKHMEISVISPLFLLSPAITAILCAVFLGEYLTPVQVSGIGLLLLGAYVLQTQPGGGPWEPFHALRDSRYLHFLFIGLLLYGISAMFDRANLSAYGLHPSGYIELIFLLQAVLIGLAWAFGSRGWKTIKEQPIQWGPLIAVTLLVAGYQYAQTQAMALTYAALALSVKRASSVVTALVGGEILHEHNLARKGFAGCIMAGGLLVMVWHF